MTVSVDSRSVTRPEETVFYALKGQNNDGHDYVVTLYDRGVRHFVLSERRPGFDSLKDASIQYVDNTLEALQSAAARHRRQDLPRTEVTAVTGSNGKTVVKEWIAQLLGEDVPVSRSPRSYNSQVGVYPGVPYRPDRGWNVPAGGDGPPAPHHPAGPGGIYPPRGRAQ